MAKKKTVKKKKATKPKAKKPSTKKVAAKPSPKKPTPVKKGGMSALAAAAQVLGKVGKPMNAKDIVKKMLADDLWETKGKTPHATIYSSMLREIQKKGSAARFRKAGPGQFALAKAK